MRQADGSAAARRREVGLGPQLGQPDPHGEHLVLLADGPEGYARLSRSLSLGHLAGEKGAPRFTLDDLADSGRGHWWALTGCRKGSVPAALERDGPSAARRELRRLVEAFGRDRVAVELWDHGDPLDSHRNDALVELALTENVMAIATNNVHYATPARRPLATALAAVRARRSLDEVDPWLPAASLAHLRSGAEQARHMALSRGGRGGSGAGSGDRIRPVARRAVPASLPVPRRARRDGIPAPAGRGWRPATATGSATSTRTPGRSSITSSM